MTITIPKAQQPSTSANTNLVSPQRTNDTLTGKTDWNSIFTRDLTVSDSDNDSPRLSSVATNTDIQKNSSTSTHMNTSPLCIMDMGEPTETLLNTLNAPKGIKEILKIHRKPASQVGCVPLIRHKDDKTQTDNPRDTCHSCKNEGHLILQRQAYIHIDAVKNLSGIFKILSLQERFGKRWRFHTNQATKSGLPSSRVKLNAGARKHIHIGTLTSYFHQTRNNYFQQDNGTT